MQQSSFPSADLVCPLCGRRPLDGSLACSSGCDLLLRVPRGEKALPASWQLGVALAWGFALFNQALFSAAGLGMEARDRPDLAEIFYWLSVSVAALSVPASVFLFLISRAKRCRDWVAIGFSVILALALPLSIGGGPLRASSIGMAVFSIVLGAWLARALRHLRNL